MTWLTRAPRSPLYASLLLSMSFGCGGTQTDTTLPDESEDYQTSHGGAAVHDRELDGTRWRWMSAHCTEGPLDLARRGFAQKLRIKRQGNGSYLLTYDQVFATELCAQTVLQRATPPARGSDWQMVEEARVSLPATPACEGRPEQPRPGSIRKAGANLEVLVQRSNWCNGYEVRMVYSSLPPGPLEGDEVIRHYAAHFNRRDPAAVAGLFADAGSLVEPFTVSNTGGPTRHDGRGAVQAWYAQAFGGVPWVALRLENVQQGRQAGQFVATWQYMDPRIDQPFTGRNLFTIAAGEIFESQIELTGTPPGAESEGAAPGARPAADAGVAATGAGTGAAARPTDAGVATAAHPEHPRPRRTR